MSRNDPNARYDGITAINQGVDSGNAPATIGRGKVAFAVNTQFRGGFPATRPGFPKRVLAFPDATTRARFEDGLFQGASAFRPYSGGQKLVASIGGRIFRIDVDRAFRVQDITPLITTNGTAAFNAPAIGAAVTVSVASTDGFFAGRTVLVDGATYTVLSVVPSTTLSIFNVDDPAATPHAIGFLVTTQDLNPATRPKAWFVQAEDFLVIQDNQSSPLIYDNVSVRRVNPASAVHEVPVGNVMEYSMGRIWVTLPAGRSFVAGDLVYSDSGTAHYNGRDAVLKFTENDFLNEGGEFGVPADVGIITAMRAIAVLDASLGQGPLQVLAERGVFSVDAPLDRTTWKNLERPIQTVSLLGTGATSHEASVLVNGDIWFRASDGIRSFQIARRDFGTWVNTPLSTEMARVIDRDDRSLLLYSSAVLFDNRYLLTSAPYRVMNHGVAWRGLTALDFSNVSGIGMRTAPAYDGFWNGLSILQVVPLDERCFMFTLSSANKIELWEVSRFDEFDNLSSGTPTRISAFYESPAFDYASKGWDRLTLSTGDLWFRDLAGRVNFSVEFRPDDHECWLPWHSWSVDSKRLTCLDECGFPLSLKHQYRPRMRLPLPADDCNAKVNAPYRHGFQHQLRVAWIGMARLTKLRVVSHEWEEEVEPYCEPSEADDTAGVVCCDLFAYQSQPDVFHNVAQAVECVGTLTATAPLPDGVTIVGSQLVVAAGLFTAATQAEANALALAYITNLMATLLLSGVLVCEEPEPPAEAHLLYYTLDSVVFSGPTPLYLPDSVTDLHLNLNPTDSFGIGPGHIGNATQHIGFIHAETIETAALNLANRDWTLRFWILGEASANPVYGSVMAIPGVFTFAGSLHTGNRITQITFSGGIATATCLFTHRLTTADFVTITGANDNLYEGTVSVTVTSPYEFTYPVGGAPATPETSILLKWKAFPDITQAEWSLFLEDDIGGFYQINGGAAGMAVWTRIVLRLDATALTFSMQQNDNTPEVITLPPGFATVNAINKLFLSPGSFTVGRGFYLDEIYVSPGYLWSDAESTTDWNGGAGRTHPAVPIPP